MPRSRTPSVVSIWSGRRDKFGATTRMTSGGRLECVPGYKSDYCKCLTDQLDILRKKFPGLGSPNEDLFRLVERNMVPIPPQCEGWFLIPNWMNKPHIFSLGYNSAVKKVIYRMRKLLGDKFVIPDTSVHDRFGRNYLRQSDRTIRFFRDLADSQGNPDILIVPAQFGLQYRGLSVCRSHGIFSENEFGLGLFPVLIMLMTHPERLNSDEDLWISCSGDEARQVTDDEFLCAPYIKFMLGKLFLGTYWSDQTLDGCGPVSAYDPRLNVRSLEFVGDTERFREGDERQTMLA